MESEWTTKEDRILDDTMQAIIGEFEASPGEVGEMIRTVTGPVTEEMLSHLFKFVDKSAKFSAMVALKDDITQGEDFESMTVGEIMNRLPEAADRLDSTRSLIIFAIGMELGYRYGLSRGSDMPNWTSVTLEDK